MNPNTPDYSYPPSLSYGGPRPAARPPIDSRNNTLSSNGPLRPSLGPPGAAASESNQSRAARYEDEKRRIIESCFAKKETDGTLLESYITHVRVIEDAMYPSSPPPPDSPSNNKKSRVILVAVRKSGRVRVHKARENPSGSFSIGKTWALDELSAIHIFAGVIPRDEREHMEKQWAADQGFTVTLGKPYYWQALTPKEKDFFVASLLKIYKKYTGDKMPNLSGFLPHQMEQLGATDTPRLPSINFAQPPPSQFSTHPPPPPIPTPSTQRPQSPQTQMPRYSPAPPTRFDQSQGPPSRADLRPVTRESPTPPTPEPLRSPAQIDRALPTRENVRKTPDLPPSMSPSRDIPSSTVSPVPRPAFSPKATTELAASPLTEQRDQDRFSPSKRPANGINQPQKSSQDLTTPNTGNLPAPLAARDRSSPAQSSDRSMTATPDATSVNSKHLPVQENLLSPERKRPSLPRPETNGATSSEGNSRFATPATTPTIRKDDPVASVSASPTNLQEQKKETTSSADYFNAVTTPALPVAKDNGLTSVGGAASSDAAAITSDSQTTEPDEIANATRQEEEHRPGSGPAVKKRSAADAMRKAAFAVNAFKPRQGGGAARLRAMQEEGKRGNEPDGITGVVPAPLLRGMSSDSVDRNTPTPPLTPGPKDQPVVSAPHVQIPKLNLERTATDTSIASQEPELPVQSKELLESPAINDVKPQPIVDPVRPPTPEKARSRSPQRRKRQRQEADILKYSSSLGIDPRIFEGRGADFTDLLTEFGWDDSRGGKRKIDDLEADVRREIGRAQATGWLGHVEQQETKVAELAKAFDRAIEECEELDGLFTLYSHELDTLAADIEYIEAQSQGLQVQTANQKLLQKELQNLLSMLRISTADLQDLHYGPLDNARGVSSVENALATLYHALVQIDPNIRQNRQRQTNGTGSGISTYANNDLGEMRAVREKKDEYAEHSQAFIRRFCQQMNAAFKSLEQSRDDDNSSKMLSSDSNTSLSTQRTARQELWLYNGMMLFVREVNSYEWKTLIKSYEMNIRGSYQDQFRSSTMTARKHVHKLDGGEQEALFTYQERDKFEESLTSTAARKLTVKRGKTLKTTGIKSSFGSRPDGKPDAHEVFQSILEKQAAVVAEEQNFMVSFFHLTSQSNVDFVELISSKPPEERRLPNLTVKIPFEPDKNISSTIQASIEAIYSFWLNDLQAQIEWVLKMDQLQGIGVLCALEHTSGTYEETNQEFITTTIRTLHGRLKGLFIKFVDEQVKAIEETKVKLKKRKGIISFMRTFPAFSTSVEHMVPEHMVEQENLEVRFILNEAYTKILRAMWESLTFIAKDDSGAGGTAHSTAPAGGDPEDKEVLNYHILLIENMNHYIEEVDTHHNVVLEQWKDKAQQDMLLHLTQYTGAVIRRPLGKWLDFIESTEAMMKMTDSVQGISSKPSHSRSACKKILKSHDAGEIRKGIETLKKRVEKHFGDVDDPTATSKSLITRVYDECSGRYALAHDRMKAIVDKVYDGTLEIDWRKDELTTLFKR